MMKEIANGKKVDIICLDFLKTFDKVSLRKLVDKTKMTDSDNLDYNLGTAKVVESRC